MSAVIIIAFLVCIFSALTVANSKNIFETMISSGKKLYAGVKWAGRVCRVMFEATISRGKKVRSWPKRFGKSCHALWVLLKLPPDEPYESEVQEKGKTLTDEYDPWQ